ncbi:Retrovirus-related polyprotein from transposon [Salix suchowensis]|nr:Retrovirus-related polyprotein from transposon [Salix suchowensis]
MTSLSLNVGNFVTLKLSPTNYPLWREQAMGLAESQDLLGHLTNEDPAPPKYVTPNSSNAETSEPRMNEAYITWRKQDRLLRGWLIGTLSEESLGLVVGLDTANAVWDALKNAYAEDSLEREFTLRQQMSYLRKDDNKTLGEHIQVFKSLCDSLAAIGKSVPDKEKVFCLLTSLGPHYETFTTTMLKPPRPSYSELISQLQSLDQRRNWFSNQTNTHTPQMAFYGQHQQRYQKTGYQGNKPSARVIFMFSPTHQNYIFQIVSRLDPPPFGINA